MQRQVRGAEGSNGRAEMAESNLIDSNVALM